MEELEQPLGSPRPTRAAQVAWSAGKLVVASGTVLAVVGGSLVVVATPAQAADLTVTRTDDDTNPGSLRHALANAQDGDRILFDLPPGSTITLDPDLGQLQFGPGLIETQDLVPDLEIVGPGADELTIDAAGTGRALYLYRSVPLNVVISGVTITGGYVEDDAPGDGGGIYAKNTDLELVGVDVVENHADFDGGGIALDGGTLSLVGSTVSGNTAGDGGGGISLDEAYAEGYYDETTATDIEGTALQISDSVISGNTALGEGGGDGYGDGAGGGVFAGYTEGSIVVDQETEITGNTAQSGGGLFAVYTDGGVTVDDATISGNTGEEGGGGLVIAYSYGDVSVVGGATIAGNRSAAGAGAAFVAVDGEVSIDGGQVLDNHELGPVVDGEAPLGGVGGGLLFVYSDATVTDTTIAGNSISGAGGGIATFDVPVDGGDGGSTSRRLRIERSTISGNQALVGAGVFHASKYLDIVNSTVSGNTAGEAGGGIATYAGYEGDLPKYSVNLAHSTITDNTAPRGGGLVTTPASSAFSVGLARSDDSVTAQQVAEPEEPVANVALDHTILGGNTATGIEGGGGPGEGYTYGNDLLGPVIARYSLIGDTGGEESLIQDDGGNVFDQDPALGPLQSNGGPTATHQPMVGSQVVDAGDEGIEDAPETDQRGLARILGAAIDIGSVEGAVAAVSTTVSVAATTATAVEGGTPGVFTFTRTGSTGGALTIGYSLSGTASAGDYEPLGNVTFPAGQASVTKQVVALPDGVEEGEETVIVTLLPGAYSVATPISATVTILDEGSEPPGPQPDEPPCDAAPEDGFTDVGGDNVHEAAIDCLAALGLTEGGPQGLPGDQYGPSLPVTRGQMASFLARLIEAAGFELPADPEDAFDDDDGTEHEAAINALAELGVIDGFDDGTYREGIPVERDQMASFLLRTYELISGETLPPGEDAFDDDEPGNVHEAAINALAAAGVIEGKEAPPRTYDPSGNVRRDQMASFLTRLIGLLASQGDFPVGEEPLAE